MMSRNRLIGLGFVLLLAFPVLAAGIENPDTSKKLEPANSYVIKRSVVSAGGAAGQSTSYTSNGTMGQSTPVGIGTAAQKTLFAGFWPPLSATTSAEETPVVNYNRLFQNYPNPFNPVTTIRYSMAGAGHVELVIYSVSGERVRTLINENRDAGTHTAVWDGRNDHGTAVSSGVYFYRLQAGYFVSAKKMLLLR